MYEQMLYSKAFFKSFEVSKSIVIEPKYLEIGKELKIDKDSGLEATHMKLCCLFGLFMVFDGYGIPRIAFYFLTNRRVFGEKVIHSLVHSVIQ